LGRFKVIFCRIETPSFPQEPAFHGGGSPTPLFPLELQEELLSFGEEIKEEQLILIFFGDYSV